MAVNYAKAKITYDGDGTLKGTSLITGNTNIIVNENGELFIKVDSDTDYEGVIYAPETDNYAAAVLEFTT